MTSKYNLKLYVLKVDHIITNPRLNIKAAAVAKSKIASFPSGIEQMRLCA